MAERNGERREQRNEYRNEQQHEERDDEQHEGIGVEPPQAEQQPRLRFPRRLPPNPNPTAANPYLWPDLAHITCHICGYNGHYNADCPYGDKKCYRCRQAGHIARECRVRQPRVREPQPPARQQENVEEEWWDAAPNQQDELVPPQQDELVPPQPQVDQEQQQHEQIGAQQQEQANQYEQRPDEAIARELICLICYEAPRSIVYIPCGHMSVCVVCHYQLEANADVDYTSGHTLLRCPVCRALVTRSQPVYL